MIRLKQNVDRVKLIENWHKIGGVLIMGYEAFRNLIQMNVPAFNTCLAQPGPDLVICDEGHLLKNDKTSLSNAFHHIRTKRRIALTGTPLQNRLREYYCMVNFVKPCLLGTQKEFSNRFANPIANGQFKNSKPADIEIMKRRSHVLHELLDGCVQRLDESVLKPLLPPKKEIVLFIKLNPLQMNMYKVI